MALTKNKKYSRARRHVAKYGIEKTALRISSRKYKGVRVHGFKIADGYHQPRYKLERFGARLFAARLEAYLAKRRHVHFAHSKNLPRKILYRLPGFASWAALMPGALALEPVQHPEKRRLPTGKWLDPLTRRLFRHGGDAVGIRTRTLMGGWIARQYVKARQPKSLRWLSLAGGTSAPAMLMMEAARADKSKLHYANVDQDAAALQIARQLTDFEGLNPERTKLISGDIFNRRLIDESTDGQLVDIIDMLGIFEYFEAKRCGQLLRLASSRLKPGGIIITCNMRADHPQLNLHKRGIGWPDVIPRRIDELIELCRGAGIAKEQIDIYHPADGIYNVLRIEKT